jgi:hypothetical protein
VAGLLDGLFQGQNIGSGLLSYLNSPVYQSPLSSKSETEDFVKALRNDPYGGSMLAPPQASPWDQPGIVYRPAPPDRPDPFQTGMAPVLGFPSASVAPMAPPQVPQVPATPLQQPQIAPSAPAQASPIAIGNYMMPRIGPASAYEPSQDAIPPNAQPTQGQVSQGQMPQMAPQDVPLPPALGGQAEGFISGLSRGLQSIGNGGSLLGALTGNYTDPQSLAQQNMKAQYYALRQTLQQSGMSPQEAASKAMLAVINPEAGKTILGEALTNKEKYGVISEDPLQGKRYGFVNERDQTINGKPIGQAEGGAAPGGGSMAALQAAQNAGVTGEALYAHLPPQIAPVVKAMIEGRQPLPSTTAMRSPATLALIDAAHAIDPTFDATSWKARQSGQVDFASGKSSEMVRSANQTLHHVGQLLDSMDNLKNGRIPALNAAGNFVSEQTGSGAQGAFRTNAHAVAEELSKVFKGSNLSDSEIHAWEQNLNENMSPAQQRAQVLKLRDLLQGSLHALEEKRVAAIGPMAAEKAGPIIKEEGQRVLERIDKWANNTGGTKIPGLPSGWSVQVR